MDLQSSSNGLNHLWFEEDKNESKSLEKVDLFDFLNRLTQSNVYDSPSLSLNDSIFNQHPEFYIDNMAPLKERLSSTENESEAEASIPIKINSLDGLVPLIYDLPTDSSSSFDLNNNCPDLDALLSTLNRSAIVQGTSNGDANESCINPTNPLGGLEELRQIKEDLKPLILDLPSDSSLEHLTSNCFSSIELDALSLPLNQSTSVQEASKCIVLQKVVNLKTDGEELKSCVDSSNAAVVKSELKNLKSLKERKETKPSLKAIEKRKVPRKRLRTKEELERCRIDSKNRRDKKKMETESLQSNIKQLENENQHLKRENEKLKLRMLVLEGSLRESLI
eukprot:Awhi_evm1s12691